MGGEEQALAATEEACRVYVGNLLPKANERHLTSKFARFGTIHSVWIARRPPGFAFVRFASHDAAQRAVDACGKVGAMEILGKAVRVQMAGGKDRKHQGQTEDKGALKEGDAIQKEGDTVVERRNCSSGRRERSEASRERRRDTRDRSSERRRLGDRERRRDRRSRSSSRGRYRHSRHRSRSELRVRCSSRSTSRRRRVDRSDSRSHSRGRDSARRRRSSSSRAQR